MMRSHTIRLRNQLDVERSQYLEHGAKLGVPVGAQRTIEALAAYTRIFSNALHAFSSRNNTDRISDKCRILRFERSRQIARDHFIVIEILDRIEIGDFMFHFQVPSRCAAPSRCLAVGFLSPLQSRDDLILLLTKIDAIAFSLLDAQLTYAM